MFSKILILCVFFCFSACTVFRGENMTKTKLYFGLSKPDGSRVSEGSFQAFADTVIAKIVTEGSTIIKGNGWGTMGNWFWNRQKF